MTRKISNDTLLQLLFYYSFRPKTIIQNNRYPIFNYWKELFNKAYSILSILLFLVIFIYLSRSIFYYQKLAIRFTIVFRASMIKRESGESDRDRLEGNCSKTGSNFRTRRLMEIGWYATRPALRMNDSRWMVKMNSMARPD